ncbi:diguanylate cyclase [Chromobacterium sinusclupearum]|uniref:histidine kinase n=1 Tax=Chromobacterium sinusclupearum TaxID=2077146 RepID=A0A2K4MP62_9NEIS|nr:ATP-binding protein [Chromobacterium sinusclupearum]POA98884.1 diguanylate cyclase [Chromobacterium sinusclupearum]
MQKPDNPSNETERIAALHALNILDTPPEERFDRIARLAQHIMQVPIALVSFVDAGRQWFKSHQGLDAKQTGRDISFCGHAILGDDVLCVADTHLDPRFSDNPLVTGNPHIRFYAGAPLDIGGGVRLGTLCAIDRMPHTPSPEQLAALRDLAASTVDMMLMQPAADLIKQLHDSDTRLRAVLDTVIDGIITLDAHGVMESANPAACRIFGYAASELAGRSLDMLIAEPCQSMAGGLPLLGHGKEVTGLHRNGATFPLELSISEMHLQGSCMFVAVARDISERKKVERIKNEFISTISHELRTPLTSIHGGLALALHDGDEALSPRIRQLLEIASSNCARLTALANDILDLKKIEAGHLEFTFEKVDLSALIKQSIKANEAYAHQSGVSLQALNALSQAYVIGDPNRLMQAISNLLSNAVKFSPADGIVEISVHNIQDRYRVAIHDEGRGIPESFRSEIFNRFAQADKSDTREKGGAGLGLNITKAIIERHHGLLDYESTMGTGTTFYFDLPAATALVAAKPYRLLICKREESEADALRASLDEQGIESDGAYRGHIALDLLRHTAYQAVLIDLPHHESLAMIEAILSMRGLNAPSLVLLSDERKTDYLESIRKEGLAIHWLPRHATLAALEKTILSAINHA